MKSPQNRLKALNIEIDENEKKNLVTTKFCLSCNKESSNYSSILKKTVMW